MAKEALKLYLEDMPKEKIPVPFCNLKRKETSYAHKHFIPVQGMLLEVDEENYKDFYRDKERKRYLKKSI